MSIQARNLKILPRCRIEYMDLNTWHRAHFGGKTEHVNRAAAQHALIDHFRAMNLQHADFDPQKYRIVELPDRLSSCCTVLEAMGFEDNSTGGGFSAYMFSRPDGQYCMVTNADDKTPADTDKQWNVGFYTEDGEPIGDVETYDRGNKHGFIKALADIAKWRNG